MKRIKLLMLAIITFSCSIVFSKDLYTFSNEVISLKTYEKDNKAILEYDNNLIELVKKDDNTYENTKENLILNIDDKMPYIKVNDFYTRLFSERLSYKLYTYENAGLLFLAKLNDDEIVLSLNKKYVILKKIDENVYKSVNEDIVLNKNVLEIKNKDEILVFHLIEEE